MEVDTNVKGACEKFYMMGLFQNLLITEVSQCKRKLVVATPGNCWQKKSHCAEKELTENSGGYFLPQ